MNFEVTNSSNKVTSRRNSFLLVIDEWNDWYIYKTMYSLVYIDESGERKYIGSVKIGTLGLSEGRPDLPNTFDTLDDRYFSLGQDEDYYENLKSLGDTARVGLLTALNDVAFSEETYKNAINERVFSKSLMRHISTFKVKGQFRRIANGGAKLTRYKFTYRVNQENQVDLSFKVRPESNPPTNIHAIIGRNGVGKTHLLNNIVKTISSNSRNTSGTILDKSMEVIDDFSNIFANIVNVSFSAFDSTEFPSIDITENSNDESEFSNMPKYCYIGLKKYDKKREKYITKSSDTLTREFSKSSYKCCTQARNRWLKAIETLETDPLFKAYEITKLLEIDSEDEFEIEAKIIFNKLSSGHKIVLLTMTRLVELVEEKSLVIIDEPEGHLHPPLLSAFTRALSDLLIVRNGVGIIATHSPVVLQEVPKSCVWIIRSGLSRNLVAERPATETFGENIGALTREVFKLEIENTGFHKILQDAVNKYDNYEDVLDYFDGELGSEAKAIVRAMLATKQ